MGVTYVRRASRILLEKKKGSAPAFSDRPIKTANGSFQQPSAGITQYITQYSILKYNNDVHTTNVSGIRKGLQGDSRLPPTATYGKEVSTPKGRHDFERFHIPIIK